MDGMTLARSIRELARQARRVLSQTGDDEEAQALFEAIERLEERLELGTSTELGRWLVSLRRCVEERLPAAV